MSGVGSRCFAALTESADVDKAHAAGPVAQWHFYELSIAAPADAWRVRIGDHRTARISATVTATRSIAATATSCCEWGVWRRRPDDRRVPPQIGGIG